VQIIFQDFAWSFGKLSSFGYLTTSWLPLPWYWVEDFAIYELDIYQFWQVFNFVNNHWFSLSQKPKRMDNSHERTMKGLDDLIDDYFFFPPKIWELWLYILEQLIFWDNFVIFSNQEVWEYFDFFVS
jgi:hypothetical protein